jgi:spore germination protein KC
LTGCWDYQRIDKRAMVLGVGIDPQGKEQLQVTVQIPSMSSVMSGGTGSAGSSEGNSKSKVINITESGKSFAQAIVLAQNHINRILFLGTVQAIVLSDRLSQEQTQSVMSELIRNGRVPKISSVVASKGPAKSVLEAKEIGDEPPALYLSKALKDIQREGTLTDTPFWEFIRAVYGVGIDPKVSKVEVINQKIVIDGIVAFRDMDMAGLLDREMSQGMNWVLGETKNMPLEIQSEGKSIVVRAFDAKSKITWKREENRYVFHVRIHTKGEVLQDTSMGQNTVVQSELENYEKLTEELIRKQSLDTFKQLKNWKTDLYGFGRYVMIGNPRQFRLLQLQDRWREEFGRSVMEVEAHVSLRDKGEVM